MQTINMNIVLYRLNVNVITIVVSKMTSHCAGTEQMKSETRIGKREEVGFKTREKGGERWSSGDME